MFRSWAGNDASRHNEFSTDFVAALQLFYYYFVAAAFFHCFVNMRWQIFKVAWLAIFFYNYQTLLKKKLFIFVPFECSGEVPTGTDGSGLASCGKASTMRPTTSRLRSIPL